MIPQHGVQTPSSLLPFPPLSMPSSYREMLAPCNSSNKSSVFTDLSTGHSGMPFLLFYLERFSLFSGSFEIWLFFEPFKSSSWSSADDTDPSQSSFSTWHRALQLLQYQAISSIDCVLPGHVQSPDTWNVLVCFPDIASVLLLSSPKEYHLGSQDTLLGDSFQGQVWKKNLPLATETKNIPNSRLFRQQLT